MSDNNKVVYVDNVDSSLNNVIYGGVPKAETGEVPTGEVPTGEVPTGEVPTGEVPTGEVPTAETVGEAENTLDVKMSDKKKTDNNTVDDNTVDDAEEYDASGGYDDNASSSASGVSSLSTGGLLEIDPLYYKLTKFLQTRCETGSEPENVAEILKTISHQLENMTVIMTTYVEKKNKNKNDN
jgi:hypothetical protein